jgi:plasmid maintenance system antidote protein VapI
MGRPTKNPNHPLVRLRKAISTETQVVTRKILADRVGISASTIREIETQRFALTEEIARRLMRTTAVSMGSLMRGDNPLKDLGGNDLSPRSAADALGRISYAEEIGVLDMIYAALQAAKEKNRAAVFVEIFQDWLPKALETIRATEAMRVVLDNRLGAFDPSIVPTALRPKQPKMRQRWNDAHRRLVEGAVKQASMSPKKTRSRRDPFAELAVYNEAYREILDRGRQRLQSTGPKQSAG